MKERESNMELLRVIAMFMILFVHANFWALGEPSAINIFNDVIDSTLRVFFEAVAISAVNIFVMISGWFGIRATKKGFLSFVFQCLFFFVTGYIVSILIGVSSLNGDGILKCIVATSSNWFIKSYIVLYILSPVLNSFVEHSTRNTYKGVLMAYFAFMFVYGWIFIKSTPYFAGGLSPLNFIGLYLLARYLKVYRPSFASFSKKVYGCVFVTVISCITALYITPPIC